MTDDEQQGMAERIYELDSQIRLAELNVKEWKEEREQLSGSLADDLGTGGALFIHDGRTVAFVGPGRRTVDKARVDEAAEQLPPDLRPREVTTTRYPTVGDVTKAAPVLAAMGVNADDLIGYAGRRWVMHYRDAEGNGA